MTMRTYTRKRPCHQLIEDVHSRCRLCLTKAEQPVPIFTHQTDVCTLAIRIMICVGLEITNEECLPNIICLNCREMLEKCYSFRKKCEASYQKLKSHQAKIKMMNYKEEIKDEGPDKMSDSPPPTQRLRIEEERNIYFKLDSDRTLQICDEHNKNNFSKHRLVSIIKMSEPSKKVGHKDVDMQQNITNTGIHTNSYEANYNKNITNENDTQCYKILSKENIEITQGDKQYENNDRSILVSVEGNTNIIDVNNTDVRQTNSINDSNCSNTILKNVANVTGEDISTVVVNNFVIESISPTSSRTTNNMEVVDAINRVIHIDNGVVIENNQLEDEIQQGNLVINDIATNEITADGAIRVINVIDHGQMNSHDFGLPDILTTMLLDLGVLTRHGDSLIVLDDTRTVELETSDGNLFTLEFVEDPAGQSIQEIADGKETSVPVHKKKSKKFSKEFTEMLKIKARCGICGKGFASNSGVKRHAWSVHGGQKPHQCRVCGRAFGQKEVMLRHELVHNENRPFQCPSCPKSFTQRNALNTHARSHAPPNSRALELYRCPRCPKVFLYPSGLSRHTMSHSGRVFVCGGCQRVFKDKSSLKRHVNNTKHGQAPGAPTQPAPEACAEQST